MTKKNPNTNRWLNYSHAYKLSLRMRFLKKSKMTDSYLTGITMASVLSEEPVGGHLGASVASEVLSGSQREVVEEDRHHSQVEAWEEEALSCLEGQEGLREREQVVTV